MDRLLSMILNMVLRRGLRSLFAPKAKTRRDRRQGPPDAEAETQKRLRETQRLMRRMGR